MEGCPSRALLHCLSTFPRACICWPCSVPGRGPHFFISCPFQVCVLSPVRGTDTSLNNFHVRNMKLNAFSHFPPAHYFPSVFIFKTLSLYTLLLILSLHTHRCVPHTRTGTHTLVRACTYAHTHLNYNKLKIRNPRDCHSFLSHLYSLWCR